jgi:hypothetical protein
MPHEPSCGDQAQFGDRFDAADVYRDRVECDDGCRGPPCEQPFLVMCERPVLGKSGAERTGHAIRNAGVDSRPARQCFLRGAMDTFAELFGIMNDETGIGAGKRIEQSYIPCAGEAQDQEGGRGRSAPAEGQYLLAFGKVLHGRGFRRAQQELSEPQRALEPMLLRVPIQFFGAGISVRGQWKAGRFHQGRLNDGAPFNQMRAPAQSGDAGRDGKSGPKAAFFRRGRRVVRRFRSAPGYLAAPVSEVLLLALLLDFLVLLAFFLVSPLAPLVSAADAPDDADGEPCPAALLPLGVAPEVTPAPPAAPALLLPPLLPPADAPEEGLLAAPPDLLDASPPVPAPCAIAIEDTDAINTNDNDRSVVFNVMSISCGL